MPFPQVKCVSISCLKTEKLVPFVPGSVAFLNKLQSFNREENEHQGQSRPHWWKLSISKRSPKLPKYLLQFPFLPTVPLRDMIFRDLQSILCWFEACVCLMIAFARSDWPQLARDAQRRAEVEQLQVDEVDANVANVANGAANEVNLEVTSWAASSNGWAMPEHLRSEDVCWVIRWGNEWSN